MGVNIAIIMSLLNGIKKFFVNKIQLPIVKFWTYTESILQRISDCKSLRKLVLLSLDHLPYFVSTTAFRLLSIIICITYLNIWTVIPLGIFWMTSLVMGYSRWENIKYLECLLIFWIRLVHINVNGNHVNL